jgi:hypothetical protein
MIHQALHPIGVLGERRYCHQRFRLGSESRAQGTMSLADLPSLSGLAGGEKCLAIAVIGAIGVSPTVYHSRVNTETVQPYTSLWAREARQPSRQPFAVRVGGTLIRCHVGCPRVTPNLSAHRSLPSNNPR